MEKGNRALLIGLFVGAIALGVVISQFSSSEPDGLEYVAEQQGFADSALEHAVGDTALADYGESLSDDDRFNTAVAGLFGVLVTLAIGYGVFWLVRRRAARDPDTASSR